MLSQRRYYHHQSAWPWPVAGPSWSRLALALSDIGEASGIFFSACGYITKAVSCALPLKLPNKPSLITNTSSWLMVHRSTDLTECSSVAAAENHGCHHCLLSQSLFPLFS